MENVNNLTFADESWGIIQYDKVTHPVVLNSILLNISVYHFYMQNCKVQQ